MKEDSRSEGQLVEIAAKLKLDLNQFLPPAMSKIADLKQRTEDLLGSKT